MTEIKNAVNGAGEPPVDHLSAIGGMSPAEYGVRGRQYQKQPASRSSFSTANIPRAGVRLNPTTAEALSSPTGM